MTLTAGLSAWCLNAAFAGPADTPRPLLLQSGQVIVFTGDEVIEAGPSGHPRLPVLVETFLAVRYPGMRMIFENRAWSGDTMTRLNLRLDRDVLSRGPHVVVICGGVNDPAFRPFSGNEILLEDHRQALAEVIDRCRRTGARVWLVSPPGIRPVPGGKARRTIDGQIHHVDLAEIDYQATLARYRDAMREIARQENVGFVDWYAEMEARQRPSSPAGEKTDDLFAPADPCVPHTAGQILGAAALLKAWGARPIEAQIRIDWAEGTIAAWQEGAAGPEKLPASLTVHADGRRVAAVKGLTLPWLVPGGRSSLLSDTMPVEPLCRLMLYVTGGPGQDLVFTREARGEAPAIEVSIPAAAAAGGFNLAALPLFQAGEEAGELLDCIHLRNRCLYNAWRRLELAPPRHEELVEPQRRLVELWREYAAACGRIIGRLPVTTDQAFTLTEARPRSGAGPSWASPAMTSPAGTDSDTIDPPWPAIGEQQP